MSQEKNDHLIINLPPPAVLIGALDALDVPFLAGGALNAQLSPRELIENLANAPEARLRAAIIPLLLRHPEFARDVRAVAQTLSGVARITCECFYTAAVLLQREYQDRLARVFGTRPILPDWFSATLEITLSADVNAGLGALGARHAALTGLTINWVGTYRHAAERFIRHYEVEQRWNRILQHAT